MKNLTSIILVNFLLFNIYAQNPFQDAIILSDSAELNGDKVEIDLNDLNEEYLQIFSKYIEVDDIEAQFNIISNNPFISIVGSQQSDISLQLENKSNIFTDFGSLNATNIADGLAKFLVERTKQELSIAFFQKFYKTLDEQDQLGILFPSTYKTLKVIGDEIYMFSGYIEMLRQAFQRDLATLLPNLRTLIDDTSMDQVFVALPELRTILSDGIYLAIQLKDGKHIGDALNNYVNSELDSSRLHSINENLYTSIVLLNVFSQSLRTKEGSDHYWITSKQLEELHNEKTLKLYLGLIYQQIHLFEEENSGLLLNNKPVLDIMRMGSEDFTKFKETTLSVLQPIIDNGKSIDEKFTQIKNLQNQADAEPGYNEYYELFNASLNFVEVMNVAYTSLSGSAASSNFDNFISSFRSLGNIYINLNQKQYVSAVAELAYLYNEMIVSRYDQREKLFTELLEIVKDNKEEVSVMLKQIQVLEIKFDPYFNVGEEVYDNIKNLESVGAIKSEIKTKQENILKGEKVLLEEQEDILTNLIKYGNFAALVAKAENSEQVKQAIEAVALPAGSASIKKHSKFNLALNAYAGLFYGNEYIKDYEQGWANIYGVSAPIGIAASWPIRLPRGKFQIFSSFSLYGSLVDLGAVVSYRFKDDDTESLPTISLENIFAPGIYGVLGCKNIPVSLGYGWQQGPQLRGVNIEDPANPGSFINETVNGYRWSIFIAVDIPIVNFYTKSR
ncbi:hypothetical protein JKA74_04995 [Marivirga sp. S37H4]|uniref:Uncharacterized protein n=1 Tax=Marivirga aurantiaca TaxID=2802615 RepID=A0A935C6I1_9BACT|nr:hypothetical protein [Marivirga aurantiaca]MBK6264384.1 hypothetical protein [Marivirga aurantiaca]